jgi:hypothetical protein
VIRVEELIVNESAFVPPMVTPVAPVKEVPEIFRTVPYVPLSGVNEVTVGNEINPAKEPEPREVIMIPPTGRCNAMIVVEDTVAKNLQGYLRN